MNILNTVIPLFISYGLICKLLKKFGATCRYFTVMWFKADKLFYKKTNSFIHGSCCFILCRCCFPQLFFGVQNQKWQANIQAIDIMHMRHVESSSPKKNSLKALAIQIVYRQCDEK